MKQEVTSKKVFIRTLGCQMNEYDSELIASILTQEGFELVKELKDADVALLNTCAVRETAQRKIYGQVHEIRHALVGKNFRIGILGCMATSLREELLANKSLDIDFVVGPDSYKRLPDLIRESFSEQHPKVFDVTLSEFETYSDIYPEREKSVNAWVAVMRGCNNFCTFCVVPYTRGRERSRSVENIVAEVKRLADEGFPQVTLLGQNVNSYRSEGFDFAGLLEAVSRVEGIKRIRFTSPHPKDFPLDLIEVIADNAKVCKHIHLPLQAGNNRVLELMNRTYTKDDYLKLVHAIRKRCPGIALTTDIIVGFPTETPEEFEDTVAVMREVQFDSAFIFKYSPRKGTIASRKYRDDISEEEKTRRIVLLNDLQTEITLKKNREHIGQIHSTMIEALKAKRSENLVQGRNDANKIVIISDDNYQLGQIVPVRITAATPHVLKGEKIAASA